MIGSCVIGDKQIGPTVVVVVTPGCAQAVIFFGIVNPSFFRHFFKGAVAAVVVEQIGFSLHAPRPALHRCTFELAELGRAESGQIIHVDVNISGDEQIDVSVAIVVRPGRARREPAAAHSSFVGYVFESAIAFVAIERVAAVAGHEEIEVAIVVEVSDGDAHSPTFARESGLVGDVSELEVGIVMPESDERIAAALLVAIDGRAVHHYDVEFSVIVAVEEADSAAHGFDHVIFFARGDVGGG